MRENRNNQLGKRLEDFRPNTDPDDRKRLPTKDAGEPLHFDLSPAPEVGPRNRNAGEVPHRKLALALVPEPEWTGISASKGPSAAGSHRAQEDGKGSPTGSFFIPAKGIFMPTTIEMVEGATGSAKLQILAAFIDQVRQDQAAMSERMGELALSCGAGSYDVEIETLELSELADRYGATVGTMRKQICSVVGKDAVIKVGKKWVIRKTLFLDFLKTLEGQSEAA